MEIDTRTQHLLKTLINHHIADGQPVGSKTLTASSGLDLSSASIRNIMKDLEDAGFIQAHILLQVEYQRIKGIVFLSIAWLR